MNHGCYEHEQVKKWNYNLYNEILKVKQVFREMSEINQRHDITLYQEVCEKAKKEIEKLMLNKYDCIKNNKGKLKEYFNEYLD